MDHPRFVYKSQSLWKSIQSKVCHHCTSNPAHQPFDLHTPHDLRCRSWAFAGVPGMMTTSSLPPATVASLPAQLKAISMTFCSRSMHRLFLPLPPCSCCLLPHPPPPPPRPSYHAPQVTLSVGLTVCRGRGGQRKRTAQSTRALAPGGSCNCGLLMMHRRQLAPAAAVSALAAAAVAAAAAAACAP